MERQQFISFIKEPNALDKGSLEGIETLSKQFPYCQSLQILHLLNLKMIDHVMFSDQLKSTAAHIADRKRLRELIRGFKADEERITNKKQEIIRVEPEEAVQPTESLESLETVEPGKADKTIVPIIEQEEEVRLQRLMEIVENRLKEIAFEKEESILSKEELIEKFIREEPSISRPKSDFFNPVKVAKSSREDQPGLVTETLARIHIQQGNIDKAIEIYHKLSLNFPEKSSYFAAQIEKLST
jgi:hypothetical protein